jgi:flagellar hook-length control protein FliK
MMLGTNDTAEGWATVLQWASRARQSGKLSGPALDAANTLANLQDAAPEELPRLLRSFVQTSGNEAKLANESELPNTPDLRSSISRLMQDPAMRALLDDAGESRSFDQAASRALSRLDAAASANLHGLERSYAFFEIPPAWLGNANRAQVHVFGEGGGNKGSDKYSAASVVLDLDLESLGALWIQLRRDAAACACDIAADREETRELLNIHRDDLATRLNESGLPHVLVRVHEWRVEERPARLAALLAPPRPLDASA